MFQLKILSGRQAGGTWSARRFPVSVGRLPTADLSLQDGGIWDEHFEIALSDSNEFILVAKSDGLLAVNGAPSKKTALRNGDIIEAGTTKLQFWLGEVGQIGLRWRERLIWVLVMTVCLIQIVVIYLLLD